MKKLLAFTILIVLAVTLTMSVLSFAITTTPYSTQNSVAMALESSYIQIPDKTEISKLTHASVSSIAFCDGTSFEPLFLLPTTYFVKVTGAKIKSARIGDHIPVIYNGLVGFVFVEDFEKEPIETQNPTVDSSGEAPLLTLTYIGSEPLNIKSHSVDSSWTITYLGQGCNIDGVPDETKVFVKCAKADAIVYGNMPVSNVAEFVVPLHQVVLNAQSALNPGEASDGEVPSVSPFGNDTVVKTVLIIGIIVPAVLIIFLLFKPRKRPDTYDSRSRRMAEPSRYDNGNNRRTNYDEPRYANDYERYDRERDRDRDGGYRPRDYRDDER